MKIIQILYNDGRQVIFECEGEYITVPWHKFQAENPSEVLDAYPVGLQAVPTSHWDCIKRNGIAKQIQ